MIADATEQAQVYLPDDLLEEILTQTSSISGSIREGFDRFCQCRQAMRAQLLARRLIRGTAELGTPTQCPSVAAVDGGLAIERSLGADTALVVAVGVEGLLPEGRRFWSGVQYAHWEQVVVHQGGETSRRYALGVMASLELQILAAAPHDVVILDGSHLTPVIGLNSMLSLADEALSRSAAYHLIEHQTIEHLSAAMRCPRIVAMVKYDASRDLIETWLSDFESTYDDRTAMTMLLESGEFTQPVRVGQTPRSRENWGNLHITVASPHISNRIEMEKAFNEALESPRRRDVFFTYYKPHDWAPAYRVEFKQDTVDPSDQLANILCAISDQVVSPEIREPYPQYLADIMAKSVGDGMAALRTAVFHDLSSSSANEYLRLFTQSYRSEV